MKPTALLPVLAGLAVANPVDVDIEARQSCPGVYVFGARETTAPPGYGTSQGLVNMGLSAYSGSQSAAISYPACGGQSRATSSSMTYRPSVVIRSHPSIPSRRWALLAARTPGPVSVRGMVIFSQV
jgi:hypothetical protein